MHTHTPHVQKRPCPAPRCHRQNSRRLRARTAQLLFYLYVHLSGAGTKGTAFVVYQVLKALESIRILPAFRREDRCFMSHSITPGVAKSLGELVRNSVAGTPLPEWSIFNKHTLRVHFKSFGLPEKTFCGLVD